MKMAVLRPFLRDDGSIEDRSVIDVPEHRAREMERAKTGVRLVNYVGPCKEAASEGTPRPIRTRPIGGRTGVVKPASSSPPVPAQRKRGSRKRKAKQES